MELQVPPEPVPIRTDAGGVIRVGGTRATLDTVVAAFDAGATAEEIVQQYPSVALADIYSVVAYHRRHQSEVRAYLAQRSRWEMARASASFGCLEACRKAKDWFFGLRSRLSTR